jgi:aspartyl-tRNA(Asn)/glutamyl-tRNA(Gln) amidotransferase subunit B
MDPAWVEEVRAGLPELPGARIARFTEQYGLSRADAVVLGGAGALARFFEEVVARGVDAKLAANWTMGEYLAHLNAAGLEPGHGHVTPERLAGLVRLVAEGTVSTSAAKDVFAKMIAERAEPAAIVETHGLGQISDGAKLEAVVADVVAANPAQVEQYRGGKPQVIGFLVGQVMKATGGRANPKLVNELLRKTLDA